MTTGWAKFSSELNFNAAAKLIVAVDMQLMLVKNWPHLFEKVMDVTKLSIDRSKPNVRHIIKLN